MFVYKWACLILNVCSYMIISFKNWDSILINYFSRFWEMFPYKENSYDQVLDLEFIYVTLFPPMWAA